MRPSSRSASAVRRAPCRSNQKSPQSSHANISTRSSSDAERRPWVSESEPHDSQTRGDSRYAGSAFTTVVLGRTNARLEHGARRNTGGSSGFATKAPRRFGSIDRDARPMRSMPVGARDLGPRRVRLPLLRHAQRRPRRRGRRRPLCDRRAARRTRPDGSGRSTAPSVQRSAGRHQLGDVPFLLFPVRDGRSRRGHVSELPDAALPRRGRFFEGDGLVGALRPSSAYSAPARSSQSASV